MPLERIGPEDVATWFDPANREKSGAANRALEILRAMMFRAEEWGLRERGSIPSPASRRTRATTSFLDADELARLGHALDAREAAEKVGAIIASAMTGQRPRPITHRQ